MSCAPFSHQHAPPQCPIICADPIIVYGEMPCLLPAPRCPNKPQQYSFRFVKPWVKPICCRPLCQRSQCISPLDCNITSRGSLVLCCGKCVKGQKKNKIKLDRNTKTHNNKKLKKSHEIDKNLNLPDVKKDGSEPPTTSIIKFDTENEDNSSLRQSK